MIVPLLFLASMSGLAACEAAPPARLPPGCANLLNLRAMLADPADLERARALAPPVGEPAQRPAERLRRGEPAPLPTAGSGAVP